MAVKLSKAVIDRTAHPGAGEPDVFLRDSELRGFGLRVTHNSKSFVLEKRIRGRPRRFTLGPFGVYTVEEARKLAQARIAEIVQGGDPVAAKRAQRAGLTFGELAAVYRERHLPRKRSRENDEGILKKYLHVWNGRKLSEIRREDVARIHTEVGRQHPVWANRVLACVSTMFNKGKEWGVFHGENPATGVTKYPEQSRTRYLEPAELRRFLEALAGEQDVFVRTAVMVGLLTGTRKMEFLSMKWSDINWEWGTWEIPETKSGLPHVLPLPKPVLQLLKDVPRLDGNPHVFPGRYGRHHLQGVRGAWRRILRTAELTNLRLHDLRRTVGSWMAISGVSLQTIGKTLNHQDFSTTQVYARMNLDPIRHALDANADQMLQIGRSGGDRAR